MFHGKQWVFPHQPESIGIYVVFVHPIEPSKLVESKLGIIDVGEPVIHVAFEDV